MSMLFARSVTLPLWLVVFAIAVFPRTFESGELLTLVALGLMLSATASMLSKHVEAGRALSPAVAPDRSACAAAATDARDVARMDSDSG